MKKVLFLILGLVLALALAPTIGAPVMACWEASTALTISASATQVLPGDTVVLTITDHNDGELALTSPYVELYDGVDTVELYRTSTEFAGGDTSNYGILDVGETWQWIVTVTVNATTTYTATGHGLAPDGADVTYPGDPDERGSIEVRVNGADGGEGCTPGWWKNHQVAWVGYSPGDTVGSVFDVPFPDLVDKTLLQALRSGGGKGVEGAAKNLLRHAVAALLNAAHPDINYPHSEGDVIADVNAALNSGDRDTILSLAEQLDSDNNLGCSCDN